MTPNCVLVLTLLIPLTACGGSVAASDADDERVTARYEVTWPDAAAFTQKSSKQVDDCAELPGATADGSTLSMPPHVSVKFDGTKPQQERLVDCLDDGVRRVRSV